MARWFPSARISRIHGQARQFGKRLVVPMYHPAAALHQPSLRQMVIEDFRKLPELLKQFQDSPATQPDTNEQDSDQFEQLSLF
jgi:DNA polymerase